MLPSFLECMPCMFSQLVDVAKFNGLDDEQGQEMMHAAMKKMIAYDLLNGSAPEITALIHKDIRKLIGIDDLYYDAKRASNTKALALQNKVENLVSAEEDKLLAYVKMAIAGNVIDYGTRIRFDLDKTIDEILSKDFGIDDFESFRKDLVKPQQNILYFGDNAGEIVFDKLLIGYLKREFDHRITYLVKSAPILNDILIEDAEEVKMEELVTVLESGSTTPGSLYKEFKPEVKELYKQADLIISKGQGNFETLPRDKNKTYFLLKLKCHKLAELFEIKLGDLIVQKVP